MVVLKTATSVPIDIHHQKSVNTMKTNQIFDWNRFTAVLRKEFSENGRTLLLITLGVYLWYTITMIASNFTTLDGRYMINPYFFGFIAAILAGSAFGGLTTRIKRTELFMSPSSTAEKFIVNVLLYVVSAFVLFAVAFELADITRYIVMSLFNSKLGIESTPPDNLVEFFRRASKDLYSPLDRAMTLNIFIESLGAGTIFFLGSVLWPHRSVIKTATVLLGFTLVKLIALGISMYSKFGVHLEELPENMFDNFMNTAAIANFWIDAVVIVGSLILAWYTIKHKDVITVKWWK